MTIKRNIFLKLALQLTSFYARQAREVDTDLLLAPPTQMAENSSNQTRQDFGLLLGASEPEFTEVRSNLSASHALLHVGW